MMKLVVELEKKRERERERERERFPSVRSVRNLRLKRVSGMNPDQPEGLGYPNNAQQQLTRARSCGSKVGA
jgi:hypothetical protein